MVMEEQKGTLKVGVVGMGPVGQILAVHLKEAGCHVTICDRNKERVDLIRKDGLRLEGKMARHVRPDQAFHTASELAAEKPDVIILAIKVYHTRAVIEELLGEGAGKPFIICAQNGIDVEEPVADVFGEQYTFRMVLNFAGNLAKPNAVSASQGYSPAWTWTPWSSTRSPWWTRCGRRPSSTPRSARFAAFHALRSARPWSSRAWRRSSNR